MQSTWVSERKRERMRQYKPLYQNEVGPQVDVESVIQYDPVYRVRVCIQHQHAVRDLKRHLRDEHLELSLAQRKEILSQHQNDNCVEATVFQPPTVPVLPLAYLQAPVVVLQCNELGCDRRLASEVQMLQHCRQQHGWKRSSTQLVHWSKILAQTFFIGALTKYFPVQRGLQSQGLTLEPEDTPVETVLPLSTQEDRILAELASQQLRQARATLDERQQAKHQHELKMQQADAEIMKQDQTGWFARNQWPQHFAGRNLIYLSQCSRLPDKTETGLTELVRIFDQIWCDAVDGLLLLDLETRRWLRSPKVNDPDVRPLARLQTDTALDRYAGYIRRLLCYIVRVWTAEQKMTEQMPTRRTRTSLVLQIEDNDEDSNTTEDTSDDGSDPEYIQSSQNTTQSNQKSDAEIDKTADARELFPWQPGQKELLEQLTDYLTSPSISSITIEQAQDLVLQLCHNLIFFKVAQDQFSSSLVHFTGILAIDPEICRFRPAVDFSYVLAGLVYCIRVLAVERLIPRQDRADLQNQIEVLERFLTGRRQYLVDGSYTPTSVLLSLLAYSKSITMKTEHQGNISWTPDRRILYYQGHPIYLSSFQQMVSDVLSRTEDLLWEKLLWLPERSQRFLLSLENMVDDMTQTRRGYNFIQRQSNGLQHGFVWMVARMTYLTETERLQIRGLWRSSRVRRYLRLIRQFWRLLLLCIHFEGGMPARGSELLSIQFRNGLYQDRNIYLIDGGIVIITRYHKSQSLFDQPKIIPRRLTQRLSQLLCVYLVYVQPFQEHLRYVLSSQDWTDYLWYENTGLWDTVQLSDALKQQTALWLGRSFGTLDYRHIAISIGRETVAGAFGSATSEEQEEAEEPEVQEVESALEAQSGRGHTIGRLRYGVSCDTIRSLSPQSLDLFRRLSEAWHRFLYPQVTQELQISYKTSSQNISTPIQRTRGHKRGLSTETTQQTPVRLSLGMPTTSVTEVVLGASPLINAEPPVLLAQNRPQQPIVTEEKIDQAMHQLFGPGPVCFTSLAQREAVQAVLRNETPLVVVLPTGGGKTVLPMMSAVVDAEGIFILITPFRALTDDMVQRFRRVGINCRKWESQDTASATVLVVSADRAASYSFLTYAQTLQQSGQLRRVFLDEAHLVLTASEWRPRLRQLKALRVLACPLVMLTATLPPVLQYDFEESMALRQVRYIRTSTVRSQHRYYVQHCVSSQLQKEAEALCRRWQRRLGQSKGIVYCCSRQFCDDLATALGCGSYHTNQLDRSASLQRWEKTGGLLIATAALGTGINIVNVTAVIHIDLPWSMIDFAQESGRAGRGGEIVDSVVLVDTIQVSEKLQLGQYSIDRAAVADMVTTLQCRRWVMSEYLDGIGQGIRCAALTSGVCCDRCGEGASVVVQQQRELGLQRGRLEQIFDELASGCTMCWLFSEDGPHGVGHRTDQCQLWLPVNQVELDRFRRQIRYDRQVHCCYRCGIDQRWCQTGQNTRLACQWPGVLVPVVRGVVWSSVGQAILQQLGYQGKLEAGWEYGRWLGQMHARRVCELWTSNAMAVVVRMVQWMEEGEAVARPGR